MSIEIIGAGVGRTGTHSLKLALELLGYPCYHMIELINHPEQLPFWNAADAKQDVEWDVLFKDYRAAVDFPAAVHYQELLKHYPKAKCILTTRDPEGWHKSFGDTIIRQSKPSFGQILAMSVKLPFNALLRKQLKVFKFANKYLENTFGGEFHSDKPRAIRFFEDWNTRVKKTVPSDRLLIYSIKEGWEPLCAFLGLEVPNIPFPSSNSTAEFNSRR